jgi:serine/threonine-protein kinase
MDASNPYTAPATTSAVSIRDVPEETLKKIKHAWVAAVVSGCITLVVTVVAMSGTDILGFSAWELIDVALIFGLAFGIYRKSRTCAVIMLVYFIASRILITMRTGRPTGIPLALVFGYYFWQGIAGTFAYHRPDGRQAQRKQHSDPGFLALVSSATGGPPRTRSSPRHRPRSWARSTRPSPSRRCRACTSTAAPRWARTSAILAV